MAIIHSYPGGEPESGDKIIVTDAAGRETKSVSVDSLAAFVNGAEPVEPVVELTQIDNSTLVATIDAWLADNTAPEFTDTSNETYYGPISNWDTSGVTSMANLFDPDYDFYQFNEDISGWDVSNVTNMYGMFMGARGFEQDISSWDVSSVANMRYMFYDSDFNGDISNWDVSKATDMSWMFSNTLDFDGDLSKWDTSNVLDMNGMFYSAASFNSDISQWNVGSVTDMSSMFSYADEFGDQYLNRWNVSSVTNMSSMFRGIDFNPTLSLWDVSSVTDMGNMFKQNTTFMGVGLSYWEVSSVTNMQSMFRDASSFDVHISDWNVSNVTDMGYMFENATSFNQSIGRWNVGNVTNMRKMFRNASEFGDDSSFKINNWDVSKVTDMTQMFEGASGLFIDLKSWSLPLITSQPYRFAYGSDIWPNDEPLWGINKLKGTSVRAEGVEIANITDDKDLVTKEYVDILTPLRKVDQGNGIGFIISGRDEAMHGNVGAGAFDFSTSTQQTGVLGATGYGAFAIGEDNLASGDMSFACGSNTKATNWGSFASGYLSEATGTLSTSVGYGNLIGGYGATGYGYRNNASGHYSFVAGSQNTASNSFGVALGMGLITKSFSHVVVGCSNIDYDTSGIGINSSNKPVFTVGNGDIDTSPPDADIPGTRSDALIVYKSGKIIAPSLDVDLITDDKDLVTKEYVDTNAGGSGYSHTGAFADKPSTNNRVWEAGAGLNYTQTDVNDELWKVFSLNEAVHLEVDNPYWTDPEPDTMVNGVFTNTNTGKGLFQGKHLPQGVSSLVDYNYSYNGENLILQNIIESSLDFNSFISVGGATVTKNQPGANGSNNGVRVDFTQNSAFQTSVNVDPGQTYTLSFQAKDNNQALSGNVVPQFSLIDQTNSTVIQAPVSYFNDINQSTYSLIDYTFTAPSGCHQVTFKVAQANSFSSTYPGSVLLDEVQINEGASVMSYSETTGVISTAEKIVHHSYAYNNNITGYENSTGRIKLNDIRVGDQLRVRFDFNVIPQIANTTVEPALWYSNRDENDKITYSFPLTTQPIFYGTGTVGKAFLNRPEISAWIASEEDINALALPAIKSDNPVIIQPLGLLITIIR